uniref:complement subcomponent C1r n=1 Tax=Latimeria chalumnae TaxID=7897 RepID=H3A3I8_LATCH
FRLLFVVSVCLWCGFCSASSWQHGTLTSPNYPKPYPANNQSVWDIEVPDGYRVKLTFRHFDLEPSRSCHYDYVKVKSQKRMLGKFCGQENSLSGNHPGETPLLSKGTTMKVIFRSDFSNQDNHKGFMAYYEAVDFDECLLNEDEDGVPLCEHHCHNYMGSYFCSCHAGYTLQTDRRTCRAECSKELFLEESGVISSPKYPHPYPADLNCAYSIRLEKGYNVILEFADIFEIDDHPNVKCPYDYIQVSYGKTTTGRLCGNSKPERIETASNSVDILFHSDDSGESRGWEIRYTSERILCTNPVSDDKFLQVTPQKPEYRYHDYITARCVTGYHIWRGLERLKQITTVCQNNGLWQTGLPRCQIMDCGVPRPIINGRTEHLEATTYQSVMQYKCNEPYYKMLAPNSGSYTCSSKGHWENKRISTLPVCLPVCGKPEHPVQEHWRVLSGKQAKKGNFPWQVMLSGGGRAGGALIGSQWIMTAAHVVYPIKHSSKDTSLKIYLGGINVSDIMATTHQVDEIIIHPNFTDNPYDFDSDIALIKLRESVTFNTVAMPICLPNLSNKEELYKARRMGFVSGWGQDETEMISDSLKYVKLPIVDQAVCETFSSNKSDKSYVVSDNMFCAGYTEGGRDSCQGDSGGVFAVYEDGTWVATGIVSWGIGCGKQGHYGVYTRVVNYLDWIQNTIST